jgi:hypothetical protein
MLRVGDWGWMGPDHSAEGNAEVSLGFLLFPGGN